MASVERCRTIGTRYSAGQFLFCTMASPTPGLSARFLAAKENSAGRACSRFRASTKDSTGCERIASCARDATISSASWASTARSSARSAGARWAPPVQTAIFRSRVARPWRRSSRTSGLRVSTGLWPQVLLTKHHCTGCAGRSKRRHGLAVQFQQHRRGVPGGHLEPLIGRIMTVLPGGQLGVQKKFVVREDAHTRGGGGGNGKVEKCRRRGTGKGHRRSLTRRSRRTGTGLRLGLHGQGSSGGFFCGAVGGVAAPAIAAGVKNPGHQEKHDENGRNRKPLRRRWNAVLSSGGSRGQMFRAGQVVFTEECFFIEAQIAHDGAHEAVAEDAPGQLGPIFIFQGFDKTCADARGLGELVHGNFAQLALALQAFSKISPGHELKPVLDNPSATAMRSFTSATAKRPTRRALAIIQRGIPQRTIGGPIPQCQTAWNVASG